MFGWGRCDLGNGFVKKKKEWILKTNLEFDYCIKINIFHG
jgi:hypothetical protein